MEPGKSLSLSSSGLGSALVIELFLCNNNNLSPQGGDAAGVSAALNGS